MYIIMKFDQDVKKNFSIVCGQNILYLTKYLKFIIIYKMKKQERKVKSWTMKECELLKKHYNQVSMQELLELLPDRTENSIYKKVQSLRKKGWIITRRKSHGN